MSERDDVGRLLDLLRGLMQAARPADGVLALMQRLELTLPQILSMSRMRQGPQTVSSLAAGLHLTPGGVSRLIDQLVGKRLVRRAEGDADRRCKTLSLSATGQKTLAALDGAREAELACLLEGLGPELRSDLEGVLRRVVAAALAQRPLQPENAP
jgi:DNA-binding MarR family transcriptional regulator